jgi:hypothetical protein
LRLLSGRAQTQGGARQLARVGRTRRAAILSLIGWLTRWAEALTIDVTTGGGEACVGRASTLPAPPSLAGATRRVTHRGNRPSRGAVSGPTIDRRVYRHAQGTIPRPRERDGSVFGLGSGRGIDRRRTRFEWLRRLGMVDHPCSPFGSMEVVRHVICRTKPSVPRSFSPLVRRRL